MRNVHCIQQDGAIRCAAEAGQRFRKLDLAVAVYAGPSKYIATSYLETQT
jgi:hypothetical protein